MKIVSDVIFDDIVIILGSDYQMVNTDARMDGIVSDWNKNIGKMLSAAMDKIAEAGIKSLITKVAKRVKKSAYREWGLIIEKTFGEKLDATHYDDDFYKSVLEKWVKHNEKLMDEFIQNVLDDVKKCVVDMLGKKESPANIAKSIKEILDKATKHAMQMSKDQVAALNSEIEKLHCEDSGSDSYIWITKKDDRVRECHRTLHGKIFSWNDPPEMWHVSAMGEIVMDGRKCHPGQDYRCRCIALPIFNTDKTNLHTIS